jgi:hypothetical protein
MKDSAEFGALNLAVLGAAVAWLWRCCAGRSRSTAAPIACIYRSIGALLTWIWIEDVRRRDICSIYRRIVPVVVGWPCPEWAPRGPAESPAAPTPTESESPTAAAPTPSPIPAGPSPPPTPTAMPASVPSAPVIAVPGHIAGDHASTVERGGFGGRASDLSAWRSEGMPTAIGYRRVVRHASRSCWHGGSTGAGHGAPRSFATYGPRVAGCELMPAGRCVAGGATFPGPGTSGSCTAWADGTNARPRGRSPTAVGGSAATIAATVAAPMEAAIGSAAVETSTPARVRASSAASVTTAMLGEGGCRKEYESKGRGS